MTTEYTKYSHNTPNGHKIYPNFPLQDLPKDIQMGIFNMKIHHLATMHWNCLLSQFSLFVETRIPVCVGKQATFNI
jgi:hypothetical protein